MIQAFASQHSNKFIKIIRQFALLPGKISWLHRKNENRLLENVV